MAQFLSDGFDIHYTDTGPGPVNTLLLIHGFSSNSHENWGRTGWVHAVKHTGRRCVTLDLRGHGKSAKPHDPSAYGRSSLAGDVLALMDHLDLQKVDLMGYSMGGPCGAGHSLKGPGPVLEPDLGRYWR